MIKSSPTYLMGLLQGNWGKISPCFQSLSAQCMWPYPSEQTYVICTLWILRKLFESLVNALLLFWHQFPFDVLTSYSSIIFYEGPTHIFRVQMAEKDQPILLTDTIFYSALVFKTPSIYYFLTWSIQKENELNITFIPKTTTEC